MAIFNDYYRFPSAEEIKSDNATFKFLKKWAKELAEDIVWNEFPTHSYLGVGKIQSVILESMSPAKGWKNAK